MPLTNYSLAVNISGNPEITAWNFTYFDLLSCIDITFSIQPYTDSHNENVYSLLVLLYI